jgi:hypothetical protein
MDVYSNGSKICASIGKMIKLRTFINNAKREMEHHLKSCIENGTFELSYGTTSRTAAYTMAKR